MAFDKEAIKTCCKDGLTWAMANIKGLVMLTLGAFLLWYTYRIFLYFVLFALGSMLAYTGLRELKFTPIVGFLDSVIQKIHGLCCSCKQ